MVGILSFVSFTLVDQNIFASLEQRLILGRVAFKKMLLQDTLYNSDLVINLDIHTITFLLFLVGISIFLLFLKPWARSFVLCFIFLGLIVFSQVIFFMFDINIYVIKLILSLILVFFFTTLLDVDLDYVNWFQAFNKLPKKNIGIDLYDHKKHELSVSTDIPVDNSQRALIERELKAKYYLKMEDRLEGLLVDFQDKVLQKLSDIQGKLNTNLDDLTLHSASNLLFMCRSDFNSTLDVLDNWLFQLAPLNFEGEKGFLDSLDLLVDKHNYLSSGRLKLKVETKIKSLDMDFSYKIHIFRSLNELIQLIDEINHDVVERPLKILILIEQKEDHSLSISLNYPFRMIDAQSHSFKLKEVKNRLDTISARLGFGENEKLSKNKKINQVEILLEKEKFTLGY